MAPAVSHADNMKSFNSGAGLMPDQTNQLTNVKAKVEIVGDYAEMEKIRDLLKELSNKKRLDLHALFFLVHL
jgi:hypothetical protein